MLDLTKTDSGGAEGEGQGLAPEPTKESRIKVACGANVQEFDGLAGKTIGTIRGQLVDVMNIPNQASSFANGVEVNDGYVVKDKDQIEFVRPVGDKG